MGPGDVFDYRFTWTIPQQVDVFDDATGTTETVAAAGLTLTPFAVYIDQLPAQGGIAALGISPRTIRIQ
jgi:hypothetical protein